jgi:glycosyltransferase involved in cell wall biosynthesis
MRILIVCSYNKGRISPFVREQVESLKKKDVKIDYFKIRGKGIIGYLKNLPTLIRKAKLKEYDLIHAHYGLAGLLSILQPYLPVVVTYHGSDIHGKFNRVLSKITATFTKHNILTNTKQIKQLNLKSKYSVIPCGIDTKIFVPLDKKECRNKLGFEIGDKLVLFSSSFSRKVKNYPLAKESISKLESVKLLELKGKSREEVVLLLNAVDLVLITSFKETGPLIVKEALACNTPVVSTDVGDVKELVDGIETCFITKYDSKEISEKVKYIISDTKKVNHCRSRELVLNYDLKIIADQIYNLYKSI